MDLLDVAGGSIAKRVAPLADLTDRRVEITGPTERKMLVNALNSGAKVFMADFEDASTPTWHNKVQGQINLTDAIERRIDSSKTLRVQQCCRTHSQHQFFQPSS